MFVITGATGHTGSIAAKELLSRGKSVRAVVRHRNKARALEEAGAELVVADIEDRASLERAFSGAEAAYVLSPPNLQSRDFIAERKRTFANIAGALRAAAVPHAVFLSSVGAHHESGTGPILTAHHGERILRDAGVAVTPIRAAYFIDNYALDAHPVRNDGVLPSFIPENFRFAMVSTRDIGQFVATTLLEGPRGRTYELAGPEEHSPGDVARAFAALTGRPVRVSELPLESAVPLFTSFGISPEVAALYQEMYGALRRGHVAFQGTPATLVRGGTTLAEALRPFVT